MNLQTRREIRFGLVALALSGLLFTLGAALRGPFDFTDPGSYIIRTALSPNYVPGWTIILVGALLQLYGSFGLYRYLTYQAETLIAFLAMVLRIAGIALALPLFTFLAVTGPGHLAGWEVAQVDGRPPTPRRPPPAICSQLHARIAGAGACAAEHRRDSLERVAGIRARWRIMEEPDYRSVSRTPRGPFPATWTLPAEKWTLNRAAFMGHSAAIAEPQGGIEPPTCALPRRRSTPKPLRQRRGPKDGTYLGLSGRGPIIK